MDNQETKCSGPAVALAFLGGAVAGVVAGLLLAPKSGEETRRALKGYARRAEEEAVKKAKEARAALDQTIERQAFHRRENGGCRGGGQCRTRDHEGKNGYML